MKQILFVFTLFFSIFSVFVNAQSGDMVSGSKSIVVPENIKSLIQQITEAETNEDWDLYYQLREQIIQAWEQVDPEVAKLYGTVSDGTFDLTADGLPEGSPKQFDSDPEGSILFETPAQSNVLWGDDLMITSGSAYDISMDISRNGEIFVAVIGRKDGSTTKDSLYIYKSDDGGLSWLQWGSIGLGGQLFSKVEIMCFDGQIGGASTQESYLLVFYTFEGGWLRLAKSEMASQNFTFQTVVGSSGSGYPTDFAVDRNNSSTNYRAICLYDSSNYIKTIRSEPSSYGTVWQDAAFVGASATVGRDLDFCYGWNGAVYASFNGFNTGNLYAIENTNYADPTSWGTLNTLVTGSTDTTRRGQIIASREDDPNNIVALVFEKRDGNTYDLYWALKPSGGSWGSMQTWVVPDENKWPALYSRKTDGNQIFRSVFEQSGTGNAAPRSIRYKSFNGTSWTGSVQVSDTTTDVTGLQRPEVGELAGDVAIYAFAGANSLGVYFDNSSWTPSDVSEIPSNIPTEYSLEQNYPNPFNPSTTIKFRIPENSYVSLKVYNVLGKEIATLVSEEMNAGTYEVNFDASNLSSGVYFYKIESGNFVKTNKMILMK